jgi:glutaredoxin
MKAPLVLAAFALLLLLSSGVMAANTPAAAAEKQPQVEVFTTTWCPYCTKAISFLRANNVPFVEYDIEKDVYAAQRMQQLAGRAGVPFAIINGQQIRGWSEGAYRQALGLD